jgi:hypothetical protein
VFSLRYELNILYYLNKFRSLKCYCFQRIRREVRCMSKPGLASENVYRTGGRLPACTAQYCYVAKL